MASEAQSEDTTVEDVLDANDVNYGGGSHDPVYGGTRAAFDAIEQYVAENVDDRAIVTSATIASTVSVDATSKEIGKTLGAHLDGNTPDGWLDQMEVSIWGEGGRRTKWIFDRVAGEADLRPSRRLRKPDLVRAISAETGATGANYRADHPDLTWERVNVRLAWMRDILEIACERTGYQPDAIEDSDQTRREWIDELTCAETTAVLERVLDIDTPGVDAKWGVATLRALHDILVAGRDPAEVEL
jgi:hypothetical protein